LGDIIAFAFSIAFPIAVIHLVGRDLATLAIEDKAIGAVPDRPRFD
jgi:hypothetical protein